MTHLLSPLCWLSAGLKNKYIYIYIYIYTTAGQFHSPSTALLVDGSTPMFSRQLLDSAEALLWVWLTQLLNSWLCLPPPTQPSLAELWPWISLHQLSKELLSCCYCDSAKICWVWLLLLQVQSPSTNSARVCWAAATVTQSDSSSDMYTSEGLSTRTTESTAQAQQGFAEPTLDTYVQHPKLCEYYWVWLTLAQLRDSAKKMAESISWPTAQRLSE